MEKSLQLGCREKVKQDWIYCLKDGSKLSREKWIELVNEQVIMNGHEAELEKIKRTVKLWNDKDDIDEIGLQVYVSKFKTIYREHQHKKIEPLRFGSVKDDMGQEQLMFI